MTAWRLIVLVGINLGVAGGDADSAAALAFGGAEPPTHGPFEYRTRAWTREDGLPHNAVECLLQTRDGWLWIGTRSGLARFDGVQFRVFDGRTPGFTDDAVLDLAEDPTGDLWIATKKGLYRKHAGVFTKFTGAKGLVHDHVADLHVGSDGSLWIATQGGLNRFKEGVLWGYPFTETTLDAGGSPVASHRVMAVCEAPPGGVWVGTIGGLSTFDAATGRFLRVWRSPAVPPERSQSPVQVVFLDRGGCLWFGTDDLLVRQERDARREFEFEPEGGDPRLRRLIQDDGGSIWVVRAGKLFRVEGRILVREDDRLGLSDSYITDVHFGDGGLIWVGTRHRGLQCLRPTALRVFTARDGLCHSSVVSVCPSRKGGIWVGTVRGLMRWNAGGFAFPEVNAPVRNLTCRALQEDGDGDLWMATATPDNEASLLEQGANGYTCFRARVAPQEPAALFEDSQRRLWMGGRTGLSCTLEKHGAKRETTIPDKPSRKPEENWTSGWIFTPSASCRLGWGHPLLELTPTHWRELSDGPTNWLALSSAPAGVLAETPIMPDQRLSSYDVRAILEDHRGDVWFGTWGGGLNRLRDRQIEVFTARDGLAGDQVQALLEDAEGVLWIGTTRGLSRMVGQASGLPVAEASNPGPPFRSEGRDSLSPAAAGQAGVEPRHSEHREAGVRARGDTRPPKVGQASGLEVPGVSDAGPSVTAASVQRRPEPSGRKPDAQFFSFTTAHGLPDNRVNQILEDDAGCLWIGCNEGIYRVARRELAEVAAGHASKVECLLLDEEDGLFASETHSGSQPSACKTPDGRLWFATPQGLAMLDPAHISRRNPAPNVFIERLRAGNLRLNLLEEAQGRGAGSESGGSRQGSAQTSTRGGVSRLTSAAAPADQSAIRNQHSAIRLPPGSGHSLEIAFTALEYFAPGRLRFRYRLEGLAIQWQEAGNHRSASYANLKPGSYRFGVQAAGRDGRWTEPGATLTFAIAPFFRETWAFAGAWGTGLVLGAGGFVWWRVRELQRRKDLEKQAALMEQRQRIARDMHDDIGSRLSQLAFLSDLAQSDGTSPPSGAAWPAVANVARQTARSLDEIVWSVHPGKDSLESLAAYLSDTGRELLAPTGVTLHIDYPEVIPAWPLSSHSRHQVLLAAKEALHNAARHAQATAVELRLRLERDRFVLEVADNGCGFDPSRPSAPDQPSQGRNGDGLANMCARLEEAGGRLEVKTSPGGGTTIRFLVPRADSSTG